MIIAKVQFCGAFNGAAVPLAGETLEQTGERVERVLQAVLDHHCKRLGVSIGVDFGDLKLEVQDEARS